MDHRCGVIYDLGWKEVNNHCSPCSSPVGCPSPSSSVAHQKRPKTLMELINRGCHFSISPSAHDESTSPHCRLSYMLMGWQVNEGQWTTKPQLGRHLISFRNYSCSSSNWTRVPCNTIIITSSLSHRGRPGAMRWIRIVEQILATAKLPVVAVAVRVVAQ